MIAKMIEEELPIHIINCFKIFYNVMVHFMCQLHWAKGYLDIWLKSTLVVL